MVPTIPRESAYVMASNVIGSHIIRKLKRLGFKPTRINPDKTAQVPGKAQLVVVVPKAVSHGASDAALKWARAGHGQVIFTNSSAALEKELLTRGLVREAVKTEVVMIANKAENDIGKPAYGDFRTPAEFTMALIKNNPSITIDDWRRMTATHGGFEKTTWYRVLRKWRKSQGLPPLGRVGGGTMSRSPRPANWAPSSEVQEKPAPNKAAPKKAVAKKSVSNEETLANLVWEWMDENGYKEVTFFESGKVWVKATPKSRRQFSVKVIPS